MTFLVQDLKMQRVHAQKVMMTYVKILNNKLKGCNLDDLDNIVKDYGLVE